MDALQRARRPVRNGANKRIAELNRLFQVEPLPKERIQFVLRTLNEEQISLAELDQKVLNQMVDDGVNETDQDTEYEAIIEMRQKITATCSKAEEILGSLVPVVLPPSSIALASEGGARGFRLPKIELKKFSGEFKDWLGYWAQFEKIDQDSSLHGSDKFQYLLQSLLPGTDAHEIASSYPQSNENYPKVVEALKRRYGNEDLLLQVYIRELLKLVICNVNSNDKIPFQMLHIKLESHLRALKTLNLEKADPATWLYPLVESSLPEEILLTWQRSPLAVHDGSKDTPSRNRLDLLMEFLAKEVEIQQKITLARGGFGMEVKSKKENVQVKSKVSQSTPTLASCHDGDQSCLFCEKSHESKECSTAKIWTVEKKRDILKEKQVCFSCFKSGHPAKFCRNKKSLNCFICGGKHYPVMCSKLSDKSKGKVTDSTTSVTTENMTGCVNQTCSKEIALQTLLVRARCGNKEKIVRIFLDSGSQGSYILKSTAEDLALEVKGTSKITHSLFGGTQTEVITHNIHYVTLDKIGVKEYSCIIRVRDEEKICNFIPRVSSDSIVVKELKGKRIKLSDVGDGCPPIEILLGADVYGRLLTGKKITLSNEVTAIETKLGWTLCGRMGEREDDNLSMCILSMAIQDASVSQLWDLDLLGIRDETDVISVEQQEQEDKQRFFKSLTRNADGRYVVSLPWIDDHPPLPTNYEVARSRLNHATKRLEESKLFEEYSKLFQLWKEEDFIEEIGPAVCDKKEKVHYVPHRAVIKMSSSTTPVRPVFDASCKVGNGPSLNECLKKGNNFIKMIPDVLLLFREKKVGFVSDIRKAFQMIEVNEQDRDCMRFLWWKDDSKQNLVQYRHKRVMFGANCSPFILGAVLEFHLENVQDEDKGIAQKLYNSLYVDNCVSSEDTVEKYKNFRAKSNQLLAEAGMDLRLWMSNVDEMEDKNNHVISVLGMQWDRVHDELYVDVKIPALPEIITKKVMLSIAHQVFDPIGIVCPAVLPVKVILQKTFINKLKWKEPVPTEVKKEFTEWCEQLHLLSQVRIPRCVTGGESDRSKWSFHVFTDASGVAYGAVMFLRVEHVGGVSIQLISAKSRVAPIKKVTIPRLELLGCLIGARLALSVNKGLKVENIPTTFWSDSSTALAWIGRDNMWGQYIGNRVKEIRHLTDPAQWRHVPGSMNPADLPSRGCLPSHLLEKRWWEGPEWLKSPSDSWPRSSEDVAEDLVNSEIKRTGNVGVSTSLAVLDCIKKSYNFMTHVKIFGWMHRFIGNLLKKVRNQPKVDGGLTFEELEKGESTLIKYIQDDNQLEEKAFRRLNICVDQFGIMRVKTKIVLLDEVEAFKFPAILHGKSPVVRQLIFEVHEKLCHAGVGIVMTKLREKYWVIKARRTVQSVISSCVKCRKVGAKNIAVLPPPLPLERLEANKVFEVVGVDATGPLYLKNQKKVWIIIFTCAVFRAVRLEVVNSLSTAAFIGALKLFIRLEGRPRLMMSDNGTNFQGCSNFFKSLDWKVIGEDTALEKIQWKFNVAAAPWWGGYWERIIRILKDMMKRSIGKSTLNRKELEDSLLIMEEVINGRPLTYVSEDSDELEPLTPSMFMSNQCGLKFPEGDVDSENLNYRWKYMKKLRDELRQRFRKEYLSQLISRVNQKPSRKLELNEIVLVRDDRKKRVFWPIGRVMELIPGKDGIIRVVKVKTEVGLQTKPIQNLYPLEVNPARTTLMTTLLAVTSAVTQVEGERELKPVVSIVGE